jgi:hypothetical protein
MNQRVYSELKLDLILRTLVTLRSRIAERFPESGLSRVADELQHTGEDIGPVLDRLRQPNRLLRAGILLAVALIVFLVGALIWFLALRSDAREISGVGYLLQTVESAAQDLIFLSLAIYFLLTLEGRINRRIALRTLHRLRSIVHIVDMHQLTKDPVQILSPGRTTASSPARKLTRFELARYLDYCSELLSLSSKMAALHVQYVNDPVVLDAVNDIEVLASNLANKMWQKIVILDTAVAAET